METANCGPSRSPGSAPASTFLCAPSPLVGAGYSWFVYKDSRVVGYEDQAKTDKDRKARTKPIDEGKIPPEVFDKAFAETPKAFYLQAEKDLDRCLQALESLENFCNEKFEDDAPAFGKLKTGLTEVRHTVHALLTKKREKEPDPVEEVPVDEAAASGRRRRRDRLRRHRPRFCHIVCVRARRSTPGSGRHCRRGGFSAQAGAAEPRPLPHPARSALGRAANRFAIGRQHAARGAAHRASPKGETAGAGKKMERIARRLRRRDGSALQPRAGSTCSGSPSPPALPWGRISTHRYRHTVGTSGAAQ